MAVVDGSMYKLRKTDEVPWLSLSNGRKRQMPHYRDFHFGGAPTVLGPGPDRGSPGSPSI